jgi:NADPH:quinone reductase-like Zn-dependent oxidoreductase
MKALIRRKYGAPNLMKIETLKIPELNNNEVLIKVHATTVNRTDCAILMAKPFIMRFFIGFTKPKKIILGTDVAGEIIQIGKAVKSFKVGDKVFGFHDLGFESQAEYMITTEKRLFLIPQNINFKAAAASLEGAYYAFSFFQKITILPNQKILIIGADGGIGSALLQFVKQYTTNILATCNGKNIHLIQSLGAYKVYDYTKEDFRNNVDTFDFIFDTVGKSSYKKCKPFLNKNGSYISSELGGCSQNLFYHILSPLFNKKVIFPIPYSKQITIPFIIKMLEEGKFYPVIDKEYNFEAISKAYNYVIQGKKTGNVIINY